MALMPKFATYRSVKVPGSVLAPVLQLGMGGVLLFAGSLVPGMVLIHACLRLPAADSSVLALELVVLGVLACVWGLSCLGLITAWKLYQGSKWSWPVAVGIYLGGAMAALMLLWGKSPAIAAVGVVVLALHSAPLARETARKYCKLNQLPKSKRLMVVAGTGVGVALSILWLASTLVSFGDHAKGLTGG